MNKLSSRLDFIINELADIKNEYYKATDVQSFCDKVEQDLLHELENDNLTYHEIANIGKDIKENRDTRRVAKNTIEIYRPVINLMNDSQYTHVINKLKGASGNVKGIEKEVKERVYTKRIGE